jgi:uncharacterized membrane protein
MAKTKSSKRLVKKAVKKFSKREAIAYGWKKVKKNFGFLTGMTLLGVIVLAVFSWLGEGSGKQTCGPSLLFTLVNQFFVSPLISLGFLNIALLVINGKKPGVADLFNRYSLIWKYIVISILTSILCIIGLILLIIPGIYIGLRLMFATNLIVDKNLGPVVAMKKSWAITEGSAWQLFLFGLMGAGVCILGALVFGIGILVAIPVVTLANMYVYAKLSGKKVAA